MLPRRLFTALAVVAMAVTVVGSCWAALSNRPDTAASVATSGAAVVASLCAAAQATTASAQTADVRTAVGVVSERINGHLEPAIRNAAALLPVMGEIRDAVTASAAPNAPPATPGPLPVAPAPAPPVEDLPPTLPATPATFTTPPGA